MENTVVFFKATYKKAVSLISQSGKILWNTMQMKANERRNPQKLAIL